MNLLMLGALLLAAAPNALDGAAVAHQLATEYAAQTHGSETFVVTTQSEAHGGPIKHVEQSETIYAMENGVAKRKRVRTVIKNGKPVGSDELAKLSAEEDGPISRFGMSAPYGLPSLSDYTFSAPHVNGDVATLDFTPTVADAAHGSGTISYSRSTNRIIAVTYKPAVLPQQTGSVVLTAMAIEIAFGPVLPDRWDVVKITRSFAGKDGPFAGRGTVVSTYGGYHTYDGPAAAVNAIESSAH